jgi:DNA polymerase-3 subunit gamma/tau
VLGTAASQAVLEIIGQLIAKDAAAGLDHIHATLDAGSDPRQFARQIVDYLRDLLLAKIGGAKQNDATAELRAQMARHVQAFDVQALLRLIRLFNHAAADARSAWQPALPLEMAFIEALEPQAAAHPPEIQQTLYQRSGPPARGAQPTPAKGAAASSASPVPEAPHPGAEQPAEESGEIDTGGLTLQQVQRQRNLTTEAALNSGRMIGVKDGAIYFGFASEVLKEKMETGENIELIEQVFRQVFGRDVPLRCTVDKNKTGRIPPDVDSDGMVAAALRDLGGEIVDVQ